MITVENLHANLKTTYNANFRKYSLSNPFFTLSANKNVLSWNNYLPKQRLLDYELYYDWINENLQYSLGIHKKAVIQIYFEQTKHGVNKSSLTFLPHPDLEMPYFRFDMDSLKWKDYYHNSYHIHFGFNCDNIRFSLHRFPHPSEFIKFCLFLLGDTSITALKRNNFFADLSTIGEKFSHFFDFKLQN